MDGSSLPLRPSACLAGRCRAAAPSNSRSETPRTRAATSSRRYSTVALLMPGSNPASSSGAWAVAREQRAAACRPGMGRVAPVDAVHSSARLTSTSPAWGAIRGGPQAPERVRIVVAGDRPVLPALDGERGEIAFDVPSLAPRRSRSPVPGLKLSSAEPRLTTARTLPPASQPAGVPASPRTIDTPSPSRSQASRSVPSIPASVSSTPARVSSRLDRSLSTYTAAARAVGLTASPVDSAERSRP